VAMDSSCKTYVETDLTSLHYVTFIEAFAICPTKVLSFDSNEFKNNIANKVIEENTNEPIVLIEEHFFAIFLVYKKSYKFELEDLPPEVLQFFSQP
jgi:hypothetical protein